MPTFPVPPPVEATPPPAPRRRTREWYQYNLCCLPWCVLSLCLGISCAVYLSDYSSTSARRYLKIDQYNLAIERWIKYGTDTVTLSDTDPTNDYQSFRRLKAIVTFGIPYVPYVNPLEEVPRLNTILIPITAPDSTIVYEPEVRNYDKYITYFTRPLTSASCTMVYGQSYAIKINITLYVSVNYRRRAEEGRDEAVNNEERTVIVTMDDAPNPKNRSRLPYSLPPTLIDDAEHFEQMVALYLSSRNGTWGTHTDTDSDNGKATEHPQYFPPSSSFFIPYEPLWIDPQYSNDIRIDPLFTLDTPATDRSIEKGSTNSRKRSESNRPTATTNQRPLTTTSSPTPSSAYSSTTLSFPPSSTASSHPSTLTSLSPSASPGTFLSSSSRRLQIGSVNNMTGPYEWYSTVSNTNTLQPFSNITGIIEYAGYFYTVQGCIHACYVDTRCQGYTWHDSRVVSTWRYQCFIRFDGYFPTMPWMGHWAGAKVLFHAPSPTRTASASPTPSPSTVPITFNSNYEPYVNPAVYSKWLHYSITLNTWFNSVMDQKCSQTCGSGGKGESGGCSTYCYCPNGGILNAMNLCETWYELVEICIVVQNDQVVGGCAMGGNGYYVADYRGSVMYTSGTGVYRYRKFNGMRNYAALSFKPVVTVRSVYDPYLTLQLVTSNTLSFPSATSSQSLALSLGYSAVAFAVLMIIILFRRYCKYREEKKEAKVLREASTAMANSNNNYTYDAVMVPQQGNPLHSRNSRGNEGTRPVVPYQYFVPAENVPPPFIPSTYRYVATPVVPTFPPPPPVLSGNERQGNDGSIRGPVVTVLPPPSPPPPPSSVPVTLLPNRSIPSSAVPIAASDESPSPITPSSTVVSTASLSRSRIGFEPINSTVNENHDPEPEDLPT